MQQLQLHTMACRRTECAGLLVLRPKQFIQHMQGVLAKLSDTLDASACTNTACRITNNAAPESDLTNCSTYLFSPSCRLGRR